MKPKLTQKEILQVKVHFLLKQKIEKFGTRSSYFQSVKCGQPLCKISAIWNVKTKRSALLSPIRVRCIKTKRPKRRITLSHIYKDGIIIKSNLSRERLENAILVGLKYRSKTVHHKRQYMRNLYFLCLFIWSIWEKEKANSYHSNHYSGITWIPVQIGQDNRTEKNNNGLIFFTMKHNNLTSAFFSSSVLADKISRLEYLAALGASFGASLTKIKQKEYTNCESRKENMNNLIWKERLW